jgi:hypothetical protein
MDSQSFGLDDSEKVNWFYQMMMMQLEDQDFRVFRAKAETFLKQLTVADLSDKAAINAFILWAYLNTWKNDRQLFLKFAEEVSLGGADKRMFNLDSLRALIVQLNREPSLKKDEKFQELMQTFYFNHISSSIAKSDIQTFFHFNQFLKDFGVKLDPAEYKKLAKMGVKRMNRLAGTDNEQDGEQTQNTPFIDLLKLLDAFSFLEELTEEQTKHLSKQIIKILDMKVSCSLTLVHFA